MDILDMTMTLDTKMGIYILYIIMIFSITPITPLK